MSRGDYILGLPPNVETAGETLTRQQTPSIQHYVLPMYEVVAGRYVNVPVECGALTVLSHWPVRVFADGQPVIAKESLTPFSTAASPTGANFQPRYDPAWAYYAGREYWPGKSFTIRRTVSRLSIVCSDPGGHFANGDRYGVVHLWLGSSDVQEMGFGLPISHILSDGVAFGGGGSATAGIVVVPYVSIMEFIAGRYTTPSKIEIWGAWVAQTWAAGAGVVSSWDLLLNSAGAGVENLVHYQPGVASWDYDFGAAVEISGYNALQFNADGRGVLEVRAAFSANVTAVTFGLRCRSYL